MASFDDAGRHRCGSLSRSSAARRVPDAAPGRPAVVLDGADVARGASLSRSSAPAIGAVVGGTAVRARARPPRARRSRHRARRRRRCSPARSTSTGSPTRPTRSARAARARARDHARPRDRRVRRDGDRARPDREDGGARRACRRHTVRRLRDRRRRALARRAGRCSRCAAERARGRRGRSVPRGAALAALRCGRRRDRASRSHPACGTALVLVAVAAGVAARLCGGWYRRWLGGVTGDTLGAATELTETAVLVAAAALA